MSVPLLIQLVPNLPPAICGLGDYATCVGRAVAQRTDGRVRSRLLACGIIAQRRPDDPDAVDLTGRNAPGRLVAQILDLDPDALLLNYVGYGYAKRGAPVWLAGAVATLRQRRPEIRLGVMFHELYARGSPWESAFWLSPVQRWVARRLARSSDANATTSPLACDQLQGLGTGAKGPPMCLPVCSNVGEPAGMRPLSERSATAVVFGGGGPLRTLLERHGDALLRRLGASGIRRVVQLGRGDAMLRSAHGVECIGMGEQPASEISRVLADARLGLLAYPSHLLTKSGVAAAYLAHGTALLLVSSPQQPGALIAGQHYVAWIDDADTGAVSLDNQRLQDIATQGLDWYRSHAHSHRHAEYWMESLGFATRAPLSNG